MINYYEVEVKGKSSKFFLERLINEQVNLFDIKYFKNRIVFKVSYGDYQKIIKINTINEINIINIKGINKYKKLIKFYKRFIICFIISLFLIIIYSKMVLKININTKNEELDKLIKDELDKNNFTLYSFNKNFSILEELGLKIKNKYNDKIEWISIKKDGVIYNINVIEKIKKDEDNSSKVVNLVAKSNGFIRDMYVTKGQILKNKDDYVKKGEVIVSGLITKDDTVKDMVKATGKVYAEVWYKLTVSSNKTYVINKKEKGKLKLVLSIFNKDINLLSFKLKEINKEYYLNIFNNSIFNLSLNKAYEEEKIVSKYSDNDLIKNLEEKATLYVNKGLEEKERIIYQKTLKKDIDDDKIILEIFFKVYEDIALEEVVDISNEGE